MNRQFAVDFLSGLCVMLILCWVVGCIAVLWFNLDLWLVIPPITLYLVAWGIMQFEEEESMALGAEELD